MKTRVHPSAKRDVAQILNYYDSQSKIAGDRFLEELNSYLTAISERPYHFHPYDQRYRRCNLKTFPYHIIYEVFQDWIGILVIRHHRRHTKFGLQRKW